MSLNAKERKLVNYIVKFTSVLANLDEIKTNTILTACELAKVDNTKVNTVKVRIALLEIKNNNLLGGK